MKKSKTETAATRKRIVEFAAGAFKSQGIHATGVAEIMAAAGLTHGGFYRHFDSKEQLVAEACAVGMTSLVALADETAQNGPDALTKYVEHFLSSEFRDECVGGCPLVTMGSELARADQETRKAATAGVQKMVDIIASHSQLGNAPIDRNDAVFTVAAMVGALTLARIVDDPAFSEQVLDVARRRLLGPQAKAGSTSTRPSTKVPQKAGNKQIRAKAL